MKEPLHTIALMLNSPYLQILSCLKKKNFFFVEPGFVPWVNAHFPRKHLNRSVYSRPRPVALENTVVHLEFYY